MFLGRPFIGVCCHSIYNDPSRGLPCRHPSIYLLRLLGVLSFFWGGPSFPNLPSQGGGWMSWVGWLVVGVLVFW